MKVESALPLVAVAIDKDRSSQHALKWALDNLVSRGQTIILVHVNTKCSSVTNQEEVAASGYRGAVDGAMRELFLPFRVFCTRKEVQCRDIVLDDTDIVKAIVEFVANAAVEKLVLGGSSKGGFIRFKTSDIPTTVSKGAPDFCTVYVVSKGKVSSVRNAVRPAPASSPLRTQVQNSSTSMSNRSDVTQTSAKGDRGCQTFRDDSIKSPFVRGANGGSSSSLTSTDSSLSEMDISFVSSSRPSTSSRPSISSAFAPRLSSASDGYDNSTYDYRLGIKSPSKLTDSYTESSPLSQGSGSSWSSHTPDDVEAEIRRLRLELTQTMNMYSNACKEALTAKQKAMELDRWKMEERRRLEEAHLGEDFALKLLERERAKCRAAVEAAEASQKMAELEAQKRMNAEMKALQEVEERKKTLQSVGRTDVRYRRYTIEEIERATEYFAENHKIGEGGYGPVYKCYLDHTPVAVKVLRSDAAQGRTQFQQEVEILSCIRHPNMVLLLGACPEYGCLVYEHMANGSLEDRLFRRGNTPAIPWQHRFRIAAEIATGLLFLHETKPEPLVHRDLKPANILLDRNYVSKISDVGLARLVPPSVADNVTQYLMTSTAGTFCYIDPEYQQTGMLGIKSDIYSLGIMLLQIITAKPPMGISHHVSHAIEKGAFQEMLDPSVPDWPVEEALCLAKIALRCSELRRKDRPDLATVVLPELDRLRNFADQFLFGWPTGNSIQGSPLRSHSSMQEIMIEAQSGYDSQSSTSSMPGRRSNAT